MYLKKGYRPLPEGMLLEARDDKLSQCDDKSFGCIPLWAHDERIQVYMIKDQQDRWACPKGHPNDLEEDRTCALRETKEETHLTILDESLISWSCDTAYSFVGFLHDDK